MKRFLASVLALGLAATTIPSTASAHDWRYRHHHRGDAVAAGVVGLALGAVLGAAITNGNRHYRGYDRCNDRCGYDRGYSRCNDRCGYDRSYDRCDDRCGYDEGYYEDDDYGPSACVVRERRWDPYRGREIYVEEPRPC